MYDPGNYDGAPRTDVVSNYIITSPKHNDFSMKLNGTLGHRCPVYKDIVFLNPSIKLISYKNISQLESTFPGLRRRISTLPALVTRNHPKKGEVTISSGADIMTGVNVLANVKENANIVFSDKKSYFKVENTFGPTGKERTIKIPGTISNGRFVAKVSTKSSATIDREKLSADINRRASQLKEAYGIQD